jgi:hypothetical protein
MKHSHPISVETRALISALVETFNTKDGNATTTAKTTDLVEINYCK